MPFNSALRRDWKHRSKEVEKIKVFQNDRMMFASSTPFFKFNLYVQYTRSDAGVEQCPHKTL